MLMILISLHPIQTSELLLEDDCSVIVKWFSDNFFKLNDEKCHLLVFGDKNTKTTIKIGNSEIKESDCESYWELLSKRN